VTKLDLKKGKPALNLNIVQGRPVGYIKRNRMIGKFKCKFYTY
jgi:hypothetical protein